VMPFREPFAWATVSLFDSSVTGGVGGFTSPSSPLPPSLLGSGLMEAAVDINGQLVTGGDPKHHDSKQHEPVLVDVPGLNRVKENYMEDTLLVCKPPSNFLDKFFLCEPCCLLNDFSLCFIVPRKLWAEYTCLAFSGAQLCSLAHATCICTQDPKRLAHKPVKATLRLEVERVSQEEVEQDALSECGSFSNISIDGEGRELSSSRHLRHGSSGVTRGGFSGRPKGSFMDKHRLAHSASANSFDFPRPQVPIRTRVSISFQSSTFYFSSVPSVLPICYRYSYTVICNEPLCFATN
jgi:hypothetical protein